MQRRPFAGLAAVREGGAAIVYRVLLLTLLSAAGHAQADDAPPADDELAAYDALVDDADRQHWAFRPLAEPAVPEVRDTAWPRNAIDHFVLAQLEERGWQPAPPAVPEAILRRLYLDLIGLPPTVAEQDAFLADPSPAALDAVAAELLARPSYGERWARHWLDLVRYADSNGYERDAEKPFVWRYRDYVIQSLNDDKPYDRFLIEQLAGDELPDRSAETMIATSFYRLGPWDDEPADPAQDRFDQLDDMVRATGEVFLGLTLGCARCHDHKFEPLTMLDYYRLVAVFSPLERPTFGRFDVPAPIGTHDEVAAVGQRDVQVLALALELNKLRDEFREAYLAGDQSRLPADVLAALRLPVEERNEEQRKLADEHRGRLDEELAVAMPAEWKQQIAAHEEEIARLRRVTPDLPQAYIMREADAQPPETHLLYRGSAAAPGPVVPPGVPTVLAAAQPEFLSPDEHTSLRRLTLARWIASADNPLTARVIVNRVWQHHFGVGIVRTPSDFGYMGSPPTHPELLDWLAVWFMREGWSLKKLHRLIVESNTYRMSKRPRPEYASADPDNDLLSHVPYRRLEVEAICDSMLAASGRLNREMFGPSVYPYVPPEALAGHSDPDTIWPEFDEEQASRRTIYAFIKRSLVVPMLEVLDLCDTTRPAAERLVTSVAPQALTLFNGDFVNRQARHLAERLVAEVGSDPDAQIERAFRLTLCRQPASEERGVMREFLAAEATQRQQEALNEEQSSSTADVDHEALVQLCRVILNLNEFVYPD